MNKHLSKTGGAIEITAYVAERILGIVGLLAFIVFICIIDQPPAPENGKIIYPSESILIQALIVLLVTVWFTTTFVYKLHLMIGKNTSEYDQLRLALASTLSFIGLVIIAITTSPNPTYSWNWTTDNKLTTTLMATVIVIDFIGLMTGFFVPKLVNAVDNRWLRFVTESPKPKPEH